MPRSRRKACALNVPSAAPMFAALGDATRLRIVLQLRHAGPQSIAQLTGGAHISRQAISKHLRALERVRLVGSERSGRERLWELRQRRLDELRSYLDQISGQWDVALQRLRQMVESE